MQCIGKRPKAATDTIYWYYNDQYGKLRILLFLRLKIQNSVLLLHGVYRQFNFTNYFVKIAIILRAIIL